MGSNKNHCNHRNSHCHIFKRRCHANKYQKRACTHVEESGKVNGSRIINLEKLQEYINTLTVHTAQCGGNILFAGEKKDGLASIISTRCSQCDPSILLETSRKIKGAPRLPSMGMSTGGGHSKLQKTWGVLGVPVMSARLFINTEHDIGVWWRKQLEEVMAEASKEEKRLAEERGDYHEGVPAITVIVDGGWSKRSHRHSYNAKSGVGLIVGQATGKLLYIGVRNKYCTACTQGVPPDQRTCYKNWDESSSEMEPDIILEGFKQAEKVHGVRYKRFVGNGDSSVYLTVIENIPGWGWYIEKLECAKHACKCYRSGLEKLVQDKPSYKGRGGLTQKMRCQLTTRCAIKMRSKEPDTTRAVKLLECDLQNGPYHCFGHHERCSPDFCLSAKERVESSRDTSGDGAASDGDIDHLDESDDLACKFSYM